MNKLLHKIFMIGGILGATCLISSPIQAATIRNGGFENIMVTPGRFQPFNNGQTIDGWTVIGNGVLVGHKDYSEPGNGIVPFNSQEGDNYIDLTAFRANPTSVGIQQEILTIANHDYRLDFYVGRADSSGVSNNYLLPSTLDVSINDGARISFTNANSTFGTTNWQQFSLDFTAISNNTTIAFFNGISSPNNNFVGLDNVSISDVIAVPTPVLLPGLIGMGIATTQKRKQEKV